MDMAAKRGLKGTYVMDSEMASRKVHISNLCKPFKMRYHKSIFEYYQNALDISIDFIIQI